MKSICKIRFIWLAVLVWLGMLLYLSFQTGEGTAETSGRLAVLVSSILSTLGIETSYAVLHGILRTAAHIVVFLIFGGLLEAAVSKTIKATIRKPGRFEKIEMAERIWKVHGLPAVMLICVGIAILSEVLKIYIPGRHLDWPEVGLNIAGAWLGCSGMYVVEWLCEKRKRA